MVGICTVVLPSACDLWSFQFFFFHMLSFLLLKDGLQRKVNDKEKELLKVRHIQEEVASKIGYG